MPVSCAQARRDRALGKVEVERCLVTRGAWIGDGARDDEHRVPAIDAHFDDVTPLGEIEACARDLISQRSAEEVPTGAVRRSIRSRAF